MCWGCRETIPKDTLTMTTVTAGEGIIYTTHTCPLCKWVCEHHGSEIFYNVFGASEGIIADEFLEYLEEAKAALDVDLNREAWLYCDRCQDVTQHTLSINYKDQVIGVCTRCDCPRQV